MPELLSRRVLAFQLDKNEIPRIKPITFRELQRRCASAKAGKNASWVSQTILPTWRGTLIVRTPQYSMRWANCRGSDRWLAERFGGP